MAPTPPNDEGEIVGSVGRGGPIGLRNSGSRAATALLAVVSLVCVMVGVALVSATPASANMGICLVERQPGVGTSVSGPVQPTAAAHGHGYVYDADCEGSTGGLAPTDAAYQYNSLGPEYQNRVARLGTGTYRVWFSGLGVYGGVAHVTAYGAGQAGQCKIGYWGPDGFDQAVTIYCFDANGVLADRQFTATYTNEVASYYGFGYLWANAPTASSYTPHTLYQFSSAGSHNTIVRTGVGQYNVTMTGMSAMPPSTAESVLVSAYGVTYDSYGNINNGTVSCKVSSSSGTLAAVNCYAGITPADAMFTLTYVGPGNILGAPNAPLFNTPPTRALPSSYAWISGPSTTPPDPNWRFSTASLRGWAESYDSTNMITHVSVPVYTGWGNVQVVAYGYGATHCSVTNWEDQSIGVQCWNGLGKLTTAPFNVFFTGAV